MWWSVRVPFQGEGNFCNHNGAGERDAGAGESDSCLLLESRSLLCFVDEYRARCDELRRSRLPLTKWPLHGTSRIDHRLTVRPTRLLTTNFQHLRPRIPL